MKTDRYANASFLIGGGACTLTHVNDLLFRSVPFDEPLIPGFRILAVTEPLLLLIFTVYFAGLFSFSRAGQWLGSRKWFRWIVAVPCLFSFVLAASNLITAGFRWDLILIRLFQLLVQVTVYLLVIPRSVKKLRGEGEWTGKQWKDVLRLS